MKERSGGGNSVEVDEMATMYRWPRLLRDEIHLHVRWMQRHRGSGGSEARTAAYSLLWGHQDFVMTLVCLGSFSQARGLAQGPRGHVGELLDLGWKVSGTGFE